MKYALCKLFKRLSLVNSAVALFLLAAGVVLLCLHNRPGAWGVFPARMGALYMAFWIWSAVFLLLALVFRLMYRRIKRGGLYLLLMWLGRGLATAHEDACIAPGWQAEIPRPVFPDAELVQLYHKTWEIAAANVRRGPEGLPASPYMDENCYDDQIWIWDTCFMSMFAKYAPGVFPVAQSLENLYRPLYDGVWTPLRIHIVDNPPLFAWAERQLYDFTGDKERVAFLLNEKRYLQKHFNWFAHAQRGETFACSPQATRLQAVGNEGFIWANGACGMDNTPRGRESGGGDRVLWVDAISQQALSARCIAELEEAVGNAEQAARWREKFAALSRTINELYWDEDEGFYYDVDCETKQPCRVKTIASFWPLFAGVAGAEQARRMVSHLMNPEEFGGDFPTNSLARSDVDFNAATGDYWRGGIWLPTAYMVIKALEQNGYVEEADDLAQKIVRLQLDTYRNVFPHTIWECYSPSAPAPSTEHGRRARPEFCGWSALGPIALFIENILGFQRVSAAEREVHWRLAPAKGAHGICNLRFGGIVTDILFDGDKTISIKSNAPYALIVNGMKYDIPAGESRFEL